MKKRRFIQFIIIYFVLYLLVPIETKAYSYVDDDCLKKNTCILVCSYSNNYTGTSGSKQVTRTRNISIFYMLSKGQWKVKWEGSNEDRKVYSKGPNTINSIFSNKGKNIYSNLKLSSKKFVCPRNGYLDLSELNADNELCFDDDGKYCKGKSNIGTAFAKGRYESKKKEYDYTTDVKKYFQNWVLGDISCDDLANSSSAISQRVKEKVLKDFKTNFLKGNDVPEFIQNSTAYTTGVETGVNKRKNECKKEIDKAVANGSMDKKTGEKKKKQIDSIDADEVQEAVDSAKKEMNAPEFDISKYNQSQTCTGILGNPTDSESIAYLIQKILNYIKIAGPILVILLSSVDFVKVIWISDDESMKKAQQKLVKRLVAAVLLFLLPSLIGLMFNLINNSITDPTCGIK